MTYTLNTANPSKINAVKFNIAPTAGAAAPTTVKIQLITSGTWFGCPVWRAGSSEDAVDVQRYRCDRFCRQQPADRCRSVGSAADGAGGVCRAMSTPAPPGAIAMNPPRGYVRTFASATAFVAVFARGLGPHPPDWREGGLRHRERRRHRDPAFHRGDLVLLRQTSDYQLGDVAIYLHPTLGLVIHRIIAENDGHFVLKGDNDAWIIPTSLPWRR